jgi:hypothetical protein
MVWSATCLSSNAQAMGKEIDGAGDPASSPGSWAIYYLLKFDLGSADLGQFR